MPIPIQLYIILFQIIGQKESENPSPTTLSCKLKKSKSNLFDLHGLGIGDPVQQITNQNLLVH